MRLFSQRSRMVSLILNLLMTLLILVPACADYLGPDRTVTTYVNRRKHCHYVAVYDPAGPGVYSCYLDLYTTPDGTCPSDVAGYFTGTYCVWPFSCTDPGIDCSISLTTSIESCSAGDTGCRSVPETTTYPPATISGNIDCLQSGSGGWCVAGSTLVLSGFEPVAGYAIAAIEGTRNGESFACSGAACSVPLLEGGNAFTFWALSDWGDSSEMGTASGNVDTHAPSISSDVSGTPGDGGWWLSEAVLTASASDPAPGSGLASFQVSVDGGGWTSYSGPITLGEGVHSVALRALDVAGHLTEASYAIRVDTQPPGTHFTSPAEGSTTQAGGVVHLAGASSDALSGVAGGELSFNGGATWQTISIAADGSWATDWDTRGISNGTYSILARARDAAGNTGGTSSVTVQVYNGAPSVTIPASWYIWKPVHIVVDDGGAGLDRVVLTVHGGAYGSRTYTWSQPPDAFTWDRHFGDVIAPVGTYAVSVQAWDLAGNMGSAQGQIVIPEADATTPAAAGLPGETYLDLEPEEEGESFEASPASTSTPTPRPHVALSFGGDADSAEASDTDSPGEMQPPSGSNNLLWGAAAAALIGSATALALEARRRRKEEEERKAAEAAQFNAAQEAHEESQAAYQAQVHALGEGVEEPVAVGAAPEETVATPTRRGWLWALIGAAYAVKESYQNLTKEKEGSVGDDVQQGNLTKDWVGDNRVKGTSLAIPESPEDEQEPEESGPMWMSATGNLHLRQGPSQDTTHLAYISEGDVIWFTGETTDVDGIMWSEVAAVVNGERLFGWVNGGYLEKSLPPHPDMEFTEHMHLSYMENVWRNVLEEEERSAYIQESRERIDVYMTAIERLSADLDYSDPIEGGILRDAIDHLIQRPDWYLHGGIPDNYFNRSLLTEEDLQAITEVMLRCNPGPELWDLVAFTYAVTTGDLRLHVLGGATWPVTENTSAGEFPIEMIVVRRYGHILLERPHPDAGNVSEYFYGVPQGESVVWNGGYHVGVDDNGKRCVYYEVEWTYNHRNYTGWIPVHALAPMLVYRDPFTQTVYGDWDNPTLGFGEGASAWRAFHAGGAAQYLNLHQLFLSMGFSEEECASFATRHTELCGQLAVMEALGVSLEEGFARFVELGDQFRAILENPNEGTRADELVRFIEGFSQFGWSGEVGPMDLMDISRVITEGDRPIALVTINANGTVSGEGRTAHWVHVTEIDDINSRVYFYNPFTNTIQHVSIDVFNAARGSTSGNAGSNTVVVAER